MEHTDMSEQNKRRQYIFVIRELTSREIKRKYSRSKLGIIWSVLNPLLTMVVLSLIFSQIFKRSIENFPIYYLSGYILWQLFTGATNSAMTSLVDNKMMLIKVKFPMDIFILARIYTALVNFLYSLVAYVVMLFVFKVDITNKMLCIPIVVFLLLLFAMGVSFVLAAAYVFFGDVKYLYSVVLTLWMYMSALFYPVDGLSGIVKICILNNPIYAYVGSMRAIVLNAEFPTVYQWIQMFAWGIGTFLVGQYIFKKNKNTIMQKI